MVDICVAFLCNRKLTRKVHILPHTKAYGLISNGLQCKKIAIRGFQKNEAKLINFSYFNFLVVFSDQKVINVKTTLQFTIEIKKMPALYRFLEPK